MAEADWHRCREQFGHSVRGSEFLSGGEEGPPFHQSRLRRGRRHLRPNHGELARTASPGREQNYAAGKRRSHFPGNAEGDPFGAAHNYI